LRLAVTTVLLSLVIKLPKESSMRTTGLLRKDGSGDAVAEGWVCIANRLLTDGLTAIALEVARSNCRW
jgi:hypothetical protein